MTSDGVSLLLSLAYLGSFNLPQRLLISEVSKTIHSSLSDSLPHIIFIWE